MAVSPPYGPLETTCGCSTRCTALILLRTLVMAAIATCCACCSDFRWRCSSRESGKRKTSYLQLVMLPFWTSFLVRTYAWMFLLRDTGLINSVLLAIGVIREPLPLLYNDGAVFLGLVYGFCRSSCCRSTRRWSGWTRACSKPRPIWAHALGDAHPSRSSADRARISRGAVLIFIPCLGAYLTPDLLGGGKTVMAGNLIQNQFTTARDWPFGSAVSLMLMAVVMAC